jgi:hypothetical protein
MDLKDAFYDALDKYALRYGGQNPEVKAVFIHENIAEHSKQGDDTVAVSFDNLDKLIYAGSLSARKEETQSEVQKAFQPLQDLLSGKLSPDEYKQICDEAKNKRKSENSNPSQALPVPERLKDYKEAMGDRLVIGSVPKYDNENKTKGIRM